MSSPLRAANSAVEATLARANALYTQSPKATTVLMQDGQSMLRSRALAMQAKHGGQTGRFTEAAADLLREELRLVQAYVDQRLLQLTHERAVQAIKASVDSTVALMETLEQNFEGIARPLNLAQAIDAKALKGGLPLSLLSRHETSVNRYSQAMVDRFERVIRAGVLTRMSNHQLISKIVATGRAGRVTAGGLAKDEPAWFPEPTGYMKQRYWAERIVRTETAYAYNRASSETITALGGEFGDMGKKILATFDNRTALDSIGVHGQIRRLGEPFIDGVGRVYQYPPARPNDRETVIPWRSAWPELPSTAEPSPEAVDQAKRQVAAGGSALTIEQARERRARITAEVAREVARAKSKRAKAS